MEFMSQMRMPSAILKVGIGTTTPNSFQLAVDGKIGAGEINVTLTRPFPDYVFTGSYQRMSLDSLNKYIQSEHHLPNIPTAKEVKDNGIDLGEMNAKLLEKIEELTLYIIELKKENDQIKKEVANLNPR
jgi:hypothetical protein